MISSKNDPDYIFEEYRGYTIASHKDNVVGKDIDNVIIVYKTEDFPNYGFIVGLDDSKLSGRRQAVPTNTDDAKAYIDWAIKTSEAKSENIKSENAYDLRVNKGMLPTVEIEGHTFYVDLRMDKLRPKDDFLSDGIVFSEIENYFNDDTETYIIPYDPQKKELGEIDYETITEIPKDLVVIEILSEFKLDPIGWNRLHGYDILDDVKKDSLEMKFTARQCKWEDIYVPQKIKGNLAEIAKASKENKQDKPDKTAQNPQRKNGRKM